MILSFLALSLSIFSYFFFDLSLVQKISFFLHEICLNHIPQTKFSEIQKALICGKSLSGSFKKLYLESGIIHFMVVSGMHLIFLENLMIYCSKKIKSQKKSLLFLVFLFIFTLVCQMKAPVLKAFIFILISKINRSYYFFWPKHIRHLISLSFCLFLFPSYFLSFSLILSSLAVLCFCFKMNSFKRNFLIYLILSPVLIPLGNFDLTNLLKVFILSPIFSLVLFPLSILSFFIPVFSSLNEFFFSLFHEILFFMNDLSLQLSFQSSTFLSISQLWFYVFCLYFLRHYLWVKEKRTCLI